MRFVGKLALYLFLSCGLACLLILPIPFLERQVNVNSTESTHNLVLSALDGTISLKNSDTSYTVASAKATVDITQKIALLCDVVAHNTALRQSFNAQKCSLNMANNECECTAVTITTPRMTTRALKAFYAPQDEEWIFDNVVTQVTAAPLPGTQPQP